MCKNNIEIAQKKLHTISHGFHFYFKLDIVRYSVLHNPFFQEPDPITIYCQNNEPNPITIFFSTSSPKMSHDPIMI